MAQGNFFGKLNLICSDMKKTNDFLTYSYELVKDLWCADGELHDPNWCVGWCLLIKSLLPIMEEFKKDTPNKAKKCFL